MLWSSNRLLRSCMHARLSWTPKSQQRGRVSSTPPLLSTSAPPSPSSLSAVFQTSFTIGPSLGRARGDNNIFSGHRKSICEVIEEEPSSDLSVKAEDLEIYKRHHRPRPQPQRTQSSPQLISTTTTKPVHINHPRSVPRPSQRPRSLLLTVHCSPQIMSTDSLMPRGESTRVRGQSQLDFKTATTGVAAKAMRNELSSLVKSVSDPTTKKVRSLLVDLFASC